LAAQERDRVVSEAAAAARAHLASRDFGEALAVVEAAQRDLAGDARIEALRSEVLSARSAWAAEQEIAAAVGECERLCAAERFAEAADTADVALEMYPGAPGLAAVRLTALQGLAGQRRSAEIAECIARAAELTRAGEPDAAVECVEALMKLVGSDAGLEAALG